MTREDAINFLYGDVLDKIKSDIQALTNANPSYWHHGDMVERAACLEIIDKYRKKGAKR